MCPSSGLPVPRSPVVLGIQEISENGVDRKRSWKVRLKIKRTFNELIEGFGRIEMNRKERYTVNDIRF